MSLNRPWKYAMLSLALMLFVAGMLQIDSVAYGTSRLLRMACDDPLAQLYRTVAPQDPYAFLSSYIVQPLFVATAVSLCMAFIGDVALKKRRAQYVVTGQLLISADLVRRETVVSWLACSLTILLVLAITYQSTLRLNEVERRLGILAQAVKEGGANPSPDPSPPLRPARPNKLSGGI